MKSIFILAGAALAVLFLVDNIMAAPAITDIKADTSNIHSKKVVTG